MLLSGLLPKHQQLVVDASFLGVHPSMLITEAAKHGVLVTKSTLETSLDPDDKKVLEGVARCALRETCALPSKDSKKTCLQAIPLDQLHRTLCKIRAAGLEGSKARAQELIAIINGVFKDEYAEVVGAPLEATDKDLEEEMTKVAEYRQERNEAAAHPLDPEDKERFDAHMELLDRGVATEYPCVLPVIHLVQLGAEKLKKARATVASEGKADKKWEETYAF